MVAVPINMPLLRSWWCPGDSVAINSSFLCYLLFKPESTIPHGVGDSADRQVGDLPHTRSRIACWAVHLPQALVAQQVVFIVRLVVSDANIGILGQQFLGLELVSENGAQYGHEICAGAPFQQVGLRRLGHA